MRIYTLNINSIRARMEWFGEWLKEESPDVVLLQEIKARDENFPWTDMEFLGYSVKILGQKSYNGVAILSKHTIEDVVFGLPTYPEDEQARYIEALIDGRIRVASIYVPNGDPIDTPKFPYKLEWHTRFNEYAKKLFSYDEPVILAGDFNVALTDREVYNPPAFKNYAFTQPESREKMAELFSMGYKDAYRHINPNKTDVYTWWSYRAGSFPQNKGLLIDNILMNEQAFKMLKNCDINLELRKKKKPSDHTGLWIDIE